MGNQLARVCTVGITINSYTLASGRFRIYIFLLTCAIMADCAVYAQSIWSTPIVLDTTVANYHGFIASDDSDNLFVLGGGAGIMYLYRSSDHGMTWERNSIDGHTYLQWPQGIAIDHQGNIWIVWVSWAGDFAPALVNISKSTDNGSSFDCVFTSKSYSNGSFTQRIVVDDNDNVYLLWDDRGFTLTKFTGGDINTRVDFMVPHNNLFYGDRARMVIGKDQSICCVWEGAGRDLSGNLKFNIYFSRLDNGGFMFSDPLQVDGAGDTLQKYNNEPGLAVDTVGNVYITYTHIFPGIGSDIRFVKGENYGSSFSVPVILSDSNNSSGSSIFIDKEQAINIGWEDFESTVHCIIPGSGSTVTIRDTIPGSILVELCSDHPSSLYALLMTNNMLSVASYNPILSVGNNTLHPSFAQLEQNYPNPFNPSTQISYSLSTVSHIRLTISNVLGQTISTVVEGIEQPGIHSYQWNAASFSSGIYFYKLEAQSLTDPSRSFTNVKKMVHVR